MPITTIEVRRKYAPEQESAIMEAVHAALVATLRIPERTRTIRFIVHEPHRFLTAPHRDERFVLVTVDLFSGRSLAAKRRLYAAMAANLAPFGIPADHVKVILREIPRENCGIAGIPASEISLGYEVEV